MFKALLRETVHFIKPRLCPGCGCRLQPHEPVLCLPCMLNAERPPRDCVDDILRPLIDNAPCPAGIAAAWAYYIHLGPVALAIQKMKYNGREDYGFELGKTMAREMLSNPHYILRDGLKPTDIDVILPIPLHWTKWVRRGYNQSEYIALGLAELLGCRVADNLYARRPHSQQAARSRKERAGNVIRVFAVRNPGELAGLNVAIIDDVITTGATVTDAIMALGLSGARPASLSLLCLGLAKKA